jgi:putative ATP-binding cassette transporter
LKVDGFSEAAFTQALQRMGLDRLVPLLDAIQRWERDLSQDEQLSLAFARIVLQAPPWVLIDDAFGSLDNEALERVVDVCAKELKHSSIIHFGRAVQGREAMFSRVLHLVKAPARSTHDGEAAAETPPRKDSALSP